MRYEMLSTIGDSIDAIFGRLISVHPILVCRRGRLAVVRRSAAEAGWIEIRGGSELIPLGPARNVFAGH